MARLVAVLDLGPGRDPRGPHQDACQGADGGDVLMTYAVKEIFYSLQGEGAQSGRPAVFCRFAGCNLWSGREEDRLDATCSFCDTDFRGTDGPGGGKFASPELLAERIALAWGGLEYFGKRRVICTGGEPLLQLDAPLITALHQHDCLVAVETNGTIPVPAGLDWICVSPKAGAELAQRSGDELKVVFPQEGLDLERLAELSFDHFFIQPKDGPELTTNTTMAVDYCLANPRWRLSLQTHKRLGIP
jgi:7-carboxy-7-deazaguanine synthase